MRTSHSADAHHEDDDYISSGSQDRSASESRPVKMGPAGNLQTTPVQRNLWEGWASKAG